MEKDQIEKMLKEIITEKTGYPEEVLESNLDFEADLGIDSVKQGDIFTELFSKLELEPKEETGQTSQPLNTIEEVVNYCVKAKESGE